MNKCKCGCGELVSNNYKRGHSSRVKNPNQGKIAWNRGLKGLQEWHNTSGIGKGFNQKHSEASKLKMSVSHSKDEVGYFALHDWLLKNYGKADLCEQVDCLKESIIFQWANITGIYTKDIKNFKKMCIKCHKKFDKVHKPYKNSLLYTKSMQMNKTGGRY